MRHSRGFFLIMLLVLHLYRAQATFDSNMVWGTYKPQLIHAISQRRTDTYNPLTIAMMYYTPNNLTSVQSIAYKVPERQQDDIIYKVTHQDGQIFTVQEVTDPLQNFNFKTCFYKINDDTFIDEVRSISQNDGQVGIVYTFAFEQNNPYISDTRTFEIQKTSTSVLIIAKEGGKSSYFHFSTDSEIQLNVYQIKNSYKENWDSRTPIYQILKGDKSKLVSTGANLIAIQLVTSKTKLFAIQVQHSPLLQDFAFLTSFYDTVLSKEQQLEFRFAKTYFNKVKADIPQEDFTCAFISFSQVSAGLQFTFGDLDCVIQNDYCNTPKAMLSHTPSRFGFPRPFLWDEGFHNQITCWMHPYICLQSLTDWFNTMDENGWIPREQPRGEELRSYIPGLLEDSRETNPPTLFYNFELLMNNFASDTNIQSRIASLYPKIKLWYSSWFDTQSVKTAQGQFTGFFKWWGPSEDSNLGSGMDDWPRSHDNQVSKYNVDAQAWGYFLTEKMIEHTQKFNKDDIQYLQTLIARKNLIYQSTYDQILDPSDNLFKDILYELIDDPKQTNIFSPHKGYPNLLPLALGMIDPSNSALLEAQIDFMSDANSIWTQFGLRSLDMNNEFFGVGSNYWRGPIWLNVHYLILRSLKLNYFGNEKARLFYDKLRGAIIGTVCGNYRETDYFWEHYNQELDGKGHGNHPFTGWTTTITLIIAEKY